MQALKVTATTLPGRAAVPAPRARVAAVPIGRGQMVPVKVAAPDEAGALSGEWASGTSFASIEDVEAFFASKQVRANAF